jgi:4-cresol dehydrogenase (hydroxylating)
MIGLTSQTNHASEPAVGTDGSTKFGCALAQLRLVVGPNFVHVDRSTREHWARSTLPRGTLPCAIVQPACTADVQEIVHIAGRHRLALHPISRGKNWGYSDACAALDGQVILDLRRMNRIIEVNAELAHATIEPGVTQGQMAAYLEEHHPGLWVDATGAGPDASIVGNTLERGFGHTVNGDRFLNSCGMEIVLADGRLLRTGLGHYENAQAAAVYKWGIGPYLDGLFTQSNLGIVTRMTFWLIPRPESYRFLVFSVRGEDDIAGLAEALRCLRLQGTLRTPVHLFNDQRAIATMLPFPWEEADGKTSLPAEVMTRLKKKAGFGAAWYGCTALYGSREEVAAAARVVRRRLGRVPGSGRILCLDEFRLRWAERVVRLLNHCGVGHLLTQRLARVRAAFQLLQGKPAASNVDGARWRCRPTSGSVHSHDPLDHNAGLLWISPVLPNTPAHVHRVQALTKPFFERHGFEYQVTLSLVSERALCAVMTIAYNRAEPAEAQRAADCYRSVMSALMVAGYIPYRAGNLSMGQLDARSETFWDVAAAIKGALDPRGLISPGHYEPARARFG